MVRVVRRCAASAAAAAAVGLGEGGEELVAAGVDLVAASAPATASRRSLRMSARRAPPAAVIGARRVEPSMSAKNR